MTVKNRNDSTKKACVSSQAYIMYGNNYGEATYNQELQVRHQKLFTMFVLISFANKRRKEQ